MASCESCFNWTLNALTLVSWVGNINILYTLSIHCFQAMAMRG